MKELLLAAIVVLLALIWWNGGPETPEEYRTRVAMEEQEQFNKYWSDKAAAKIDQMSDEILRDQKK